MYVYTDIYIYIERERDTGVPHTRRVVALEKG